MRVLIIGKGNIGLALGAVIGSKPECSVSLWSRSINTRKSALITARVMGSVACVGKIQEEYDLELACSQADVVIITTPTHAVAGLADSISRNAGVCRLIVFWEGTGTSVRRIVQTWTGTATVVGLQRSPLLATRHDQKMEVEISGIRSQVVAATNLGGAPEKAKAILEALFPCRVHMASNYDCVTLSTSNPVIHPARLFTYAQKDAAPSRRDAFFYLDWNDTVSRVLLSLHGEVGCLRSALNLPACLVPTLLDRVPPPTIGQVTEEITSASYLAHVRLPVVNHPGINALDFTHRFFLEDLDQGLRAILALAQQAGVEMAETNRIIKWYEQSSIMDAYTSSREAVS